MLVIRPVRMSDLDQLVELAFMTSFGLTSLPKDRELLRKRIAASQRTFANLPESPGGETYLLVMEDTAANLIAGVCGVASKVGGFEPFYAYQIKRALSESKVLNVRKTIETLHLVEEHNGPCEIGSLFLRPSHRRGGLGRFLSLSRFLMLAEHPQRFDPTVIAEMRGVIDERGHSDFWDALGRHFFDIDFPDADYLSLVNKKFIAELMPRYPIYVALLPREAQAVIGQVHDRTRPALQLLMSEGFEKSDLVDIFEAGPMVRCPLANIRTVRESIKATVGALLEPAEPAPDTPGPHIISNARDDYRACLGKVEARGEGEVALGRDVAEALGVSAGDPVRYAPLRPDKPREAS